MTDFSLNTLLFTSLNNVTGALLSLEPWKVFSKTDIFAVRNPDSDDLAFIAMEGDCQKDFKLWAFKGPEGLDRIWSFLNSGLEHKSNDFLCGITAMRIDIKSIDELTEQDRINASSYLAPKDENAQEHICIYSAFHPGFTTTQLNLYEICFLTHIVRQANDVVSRIKDGSLSLEVKEGHEDDYLVRTPEKVEDGVTWRDEIESIELDALLPPQKSLFTQTQLREMSILPGNGKALYLSLFTVPRDIIDGAGLPVTLLFTSASERLKGLECAMADKTDESFSAFRSSLGNIISQIITKRGALPWKVVVNSSILLDDLASLEDELGIPVIAEQASVEIENTQADVIWHSFPENSKMPAVIWF